MSKQLLNLGRTIYAVAMIGLGVLCFIHLDFIIGRPPKWPDSMMFNPALAYISGGLIILACLAIFIQQQGHIAALIIASLIIVLTLTRHVPNFTNDWLNSYKSFALLGGAMIVAASFNSKYAFNFVFVGSIFLSIFFIASGYAHYKFADFVNGFIPAYIPFHTFFTYFTMTCLVAGGIGILIPATQAPAALLSGIMLLGWFLLLHIPRFLANTNDASDRMGLFESFAFAGIFFVLAGLHYKKKSR